jgi:hypothetical protein
VLVRFGKSLFFNNFVRSKYSARALQEGKRELIR